jgi:hypothetical protein
MCGFRVCGIALYPIEALGLNVPPVLDNRAAVR